ncbi:VCBS repeat-containing protein [Marixanthomonas sp. SCSIO 43207]|uniref:FG-GAP-like repeat-containing protein n=1 Tax=Marixanthomonas sp. SCSIO 43207 TaxID=2779360 RepID=UPI001CA842FB|nr:FG-GAP-like repeat-containing protein [Marixanthomonas sp. SCSIO 43207]UAB79884.1 VCBS repeat-containing protein [Marixanthomonas sp. SCSIO 43207]
MKKITLSSIAFLCSLTLFSQVTFVNQSDLIGDFFDSSECAVDMNGDNLDDYVRVSGNGIGIDYQQPDGTFESVMYSMPIENVPDWSIAAGDLDGNGFNDLVLGNNSRVSFVMANEDGTLYTEDDSHNEYIFSQRSTLADIDNDGDLDSFVCHDVDLSHPYRNDGNGNMTLDQTLIETIDLPGNYAAIWVDYDNDGDTDMYLTKCRGGSTPGDPERDNAMYTNNGDGTFTENAEAIGMKDNAQSWATVFEDFDNDGDFDAFIVNHDFQNRLMVNDGNGNFTDVIETSGINPTDLGAWENQAADFNNDGFVDIFSEMSKELYINNGDMTFTGMDLPFDEGAIADMNNDGFLDVVNDGDLWINQGTSNNNWVKVILKGTESNSNGIGARIDIYGDWGKQMREVRSGQGFSHMNSLTAHFGIGSSTQIDKMTITWPSGTVDEIINPDINTLHEIEEGAELSINENSTDFIKLYPNPASSVIHFSQEILRDTPVQIVDISGKVIMKQTISSENTLNIESLQSGVYFVQLEVDQQKLSYKFIKK